MISGILQSVVLMRILGALFGVFAIVFVLLGMGAAGPSPRVKDRWDYAVLALLVTLAALCAVGCWFFLVRK